MLRALKTLMASALVMAFSLPCSALADDSAQNAADAGGSLRGGVAVQSIVPVEAATTLEISTAEEFAAFAENVNAGKTTYSGKTVALTADIELMQDTPSVGAVSRDGYVYAVAHAFQGTFDGRGHSILLKGKPLFGTLYGTEKRPAKVKNLVLGGDVTVTTSYAGAVACIADGYVEMENVGNNACVTNNRVLNGEAGSGTGGLVGYVPATYNSYYYEKFGKPDSLKLTACYNKGEVASTCECTGGLVGCFQGGRAALVIDRCSVSGAVTSTEKRLGGFIGDLVTGDGMRVMEFKNSFVAGRLKTSVVVDENYDSQFVGVLIGHSSTSLPGAGKVANVFCGGELSGGKSYGDIPEETFKSIVPAGVPFLNLSNGQATLASLNASPVDGDAPFTSENGFVFAEDATGDDLPQLFWEAGSSKAPQSKPKVALPTAVTGLAYTGVAQAGVTPLATEGCGYTLAGWQSTDAGTHTATVTLQDGYEWADGSTETVRTVVYSIGKATLTARYAGETIEASGTPALDVTVVGFKNGETAATAKGYAAPRVTAPRPLKAASTYELVPEGGSAANYDFRYIGGTLKVNAIPKPQISSSNTFISIDTRATALEVVVMRELAILKKGTDYSLAYRDANGKALSSAPTKKGTYSVVVKGMGAYEGSVTQSFTLSSDLAKQAASTPTDSKTSSKTVKTGTKFTVTNKTGSYTYKVTGTKTAQLTLAKAKASATATINQASYKGVAFKVMAIGSKAFKSTKAKTVTLGANVKTIGAQAFTGSSFKTLTVKSKSLQKANLKNCLKGSKVTTVKAPAGYAKKYSKLFAKSVSGRKVTVK